MTDDRYQQLIGLVEREFSACGRRIIGSEEAFKSAVMVPFVNIEGTEGLLFEKRSPNIRQGGEVCFPGGRIDKVDESSIETVVRETIEETGIDPGSIEVHDSAGYLITRIGALIDVYLGRLHINSISELVPNPGEVEKLFAVPLDFFLETKPEFYNYRLTCEPWYIDDNGERVDLFPSKELGLPSRYWDPWSFDHSRFVVYKYGSEVIWGITARIVYTISKLIRKALQQ
jgi:8-oxo-dGTP pyrophosphatase MutT (NUDIX family)